jgi:hypothetical protein
MKTLYLRNIAEELRRNFGSIELANRDLCTFDDPLSSCSFDGNDIEDISVCFFLEFYFTEQCYTKFTILFAAVVHFELLMEHLGVPNEEQADFAFELGELTRIAYYIYITCDKTTKLLDEFDENRSTFDWKSRQRRVSEIEDEFFDPESEDFKLKKEFISDISQFSNHHEFLASIINNDTFKSVELSDMEKKFWFEVFNPSRYDQLEDYVNAQIKKGWKFNTPEG